MVVDNLQKYHLLKLSSLDKSDRKWVLKNLKKRNKPAYKSVLKNISLVSRFKVSLSQFNEISDDLELHKYLEKSEVDKKIDILNKLPPLKNSDVIKDLSFFELSLFVWCDDRLSIKQDAIKKLRRSEEYMRNKFDLNAGKNERVNSTLVDFLFGELIEGA